MQSHNLQTEFLSVQHLLKRCVDPFSLLGTCIAGPVIVLPFEAFCEVHCLKVRVCSHHYYSQHVYNCTDSSSPVHEDKFLYNVHSFIPFAHLWTSIHAASSVEVTLLVNLEHHPDICILLNHARAACFKSCAPACSSRSHVERVTVNGWLFKTGKQRKKVTNA